MKILYLITKANWGGAQRYVYDLATAAAYEKHDVTVAYGERGALAERLTEINAASGIRLIPVPALANDFNIIRTIRAFSDLIRLFRAEAPDVIHLNSSKAGVIGALAARIAGVKKIIFTLHGWPLAGVASRAKQRVLAIPIWLTILLCHKTIAVSYATRNSAPRILRSRMTVIPNGIACAPNLTRDQARKVLTATHPMLANLPKDALWIGTTAELIPVKGLRFAIEAINTVRHAQPVIYVILGEGPLRTELSALISTYRLEKSVLLPGFVPNAASLLPAFDLILHPSLSEALAYAVLEAGCAERPIIASAVGGIPEIITDGKNGLLVPSGNSKVLAHAIQKVLGDAVLQKTLSAALNKTVRDNFSAEHMRSATIALYA